MTNKNIYLKHIFPAFFLCVVWFTLQPIPVADLWWQMKSGEVVLRTGGIPHTEIFSYTADGLPWVNHEWLAGVVFYLLLEGGGFPLLYVFKALIILASFILVISAALKRTGAFPAAAAVAALWMLFISGGRLYFDIRPYLFTYILLAATMWILYQAYTENRLKTLWYLVPVTLLWVNTHGGYILVYILQAAFLGRMVFDNILFKGRYSALGKSLLLVLAGLSLLTRTAPVYYAFTLLFAIAGVLVFFTGRSENDHPETKKIIAGALPPFIATIVAGFLNPYGGEIFLYPFTFLGDSFYKRNLIEWIPPDLLGANLPFAVSIAVIIALTAIYAKKLKTYDFAVLAVFSYLSLTVVRHSVLFAIALVPVVSVLLGSLTSGLIDRGNKLPGLSDRNRKILKYSSGVLLAAAFLILFIIPGPYRVKYNRLNMEKQLFPVAGVEFVKANGLPGRLYNPYEWGGYLIWKLYPEYKVFMDGRANTVYTEEQYRESLISMRGDPGWDKILDKYNVNFVFCNKILRITDNHLLPDMLAKSGKWTLIFEDDIELIFIRNSPENQKIIKSAQDGTLVMPLTPYTLNMAAGQFLAKQDYAKAEELFQRALSVDPEYIQSMAGLGYIRIQTGQTAEAERIFRDILSLDPTYPSINFNLGKLCENRGDLNKASEYYQKELKINPDFEPARKSLDKILKGNNP